MALVQIFWVVFGFSYVSVLFLWRLVTTVADHTKTFGSLLARHRWTILMCLVIYLLGLVASEYQNESMNVVDMTYECFAGYAATTINSYMLYPIGWIYHYTVVKLNDTMLLIRQMILNIFTDVMSLLEISNSKEVRSLASMLYTSYQKRAMEVGSEGSFASFVTLPTFPQILKDLLDWVLTNINNFFVIVSSVINVTFISEDKHFCRYQAELDVPCAAMEFALHVEPDCDNPRDIIHMWVSQITGIFDILTLKLFGTFWTELADSLANMFAAFVKRPVFMVIALGDLLVPGKGTVCFKEVHLGPYIIAWGSDIVCALNNFVYVITRGALNDFFEFILSQLLPIVNSVIDMVQAIIACIEDNVNCSGNGLDCTVQILACIRDDPEAFPVSYLALFFHGFLAPVDTIVDCFSSETGCYETGLSSGLDSAFGSHGIFACTYNVMACIRDNPVTSGNIGYLAGIIGEALKAVNYAINVTIFGAIAVAQTLANTLSAVVGCIAGECAAEVCGSGHAVPCVIDLDYDGCDIVDYLGCVPLCFGSLHNACELLDNDFSKKRSVKGQKKRDHQYAVTGGLLELQNSMLTGDRNLTKHEFLMESWGIVLSEHGVGQNTTCGKFLYATHPVHIIGEPLVAYAQYLGCLHMYMSTLDPQEPASTSDSSKRSTPEVPQANPLLQQKISQAFESYTGPNIKAKGEEIKEYASKNLRWMWDNVMRSEYYRLIKGFIVDSKQTYKKYGIKDGRHLEYLVELHGLQDAIDNPPNQLRLASSMASYQVTMLEMKKNYSTDIQRVDIVGAMKDIKYNYVDFVNSFLKIYRNETRSKRLLTIEAFCASAEGMQTGIVSGINSAKRAIESEEADIMVKAANAIYEVLEKRYGFKYWPMYQKYDFMRKILDGKIKKEEFTQWMSGEKKYLVKEGFVSEEDYDYIMASKQMYVSSPIVQLATGTYQGRNANWSAGVFLSGYTGEGHSILPRFVKIIRMKHLERMDNPMMTKPMNKISLENSAGYNFNTAILNLLDLILKYIIRSALSVGDWVVEVIDRIGGYDYDGFFNSEVKTFFTRLTNCVVPINFDGTTLYNPFCFPLMPEGVYSWVSLSPNAYIPVQIPWPTELILEDCVNVFTGNSDPLNFTYSDNCDVSTEGRPLCPLCDYCSRDYAQCKDRGFLDWFDSFMFLMGSMPWFVNNMFKFGIPLTTAINYVIPLVVAVNLVNVLPAIVSVTFPMSIVIFLTIGLLVPIVIVFAFFWTFSMWWDSISFASIITALYVIALYQASKMGALVNTIKAIPLIFVIFGSYVFVYIVWVFVPFPEADFNPSRSLSGAVDWVEASFIGYWLPDLTWLNQRMLRFDYNEMQPSNADFFCFVWTASNFGLLPMAIGFVIYVSTLSIRVAYVSVLYVMDTIVYISNVRKGIELSSLSEQADIVGYYLREDANSRARLANPEDVVVEFPPDMAINNRQPRFEFPPEIPRRQFRAFGSANDRIFETHQRLF